MLDLIGQRFGRLTVVERAGINKRKEHLWKCECDCGKITIAKSYRLRNGNTKSCGCVRRGPKRNESVIGTKAGHLTIIAYSHQDADRASYYHYRCDCGTEGIVRHDRIGKTKSCGCYRSKRLRTGYKGISGTYWNQIKQGAISRSLSFQISMRYAWSVLQSQDHKCKLSGLTLFLSKHGKERTKQTASLDRIDGSLGYVKGNVQWVHKQINRMKGTLSDEEFVEWCQLVTKTRNENKDVKTSCRSLSD